MPLLDATLNSMADHLGTLVTHVSLHTADPGTSGTSEDTAGRQAVTWTAAATGDIAATADLVFTGGTASGPVTHVGFWSASTAGTFYGSAPLTGDATFSSTGDYTVTALSVLGSST